jgi:hypothetical protein
MQLDQRMNSEVPGRPAFDAAHVFTVRLCFPSIVGALDPLKVSLALVRNVVTTW